MLHPFFEHFERLRGERCWDVCAGRGTGSRFTLELGGKNRRPVPLRNVRLSEDKRNFEGEFGFYVMCPWRMLCNGITVGAWTQDNANDGPMVSALALLKEGYVSDLQLCPDTSDFRLGFSSGYTLHVYCTSTSDDNYYLFTSSTVYSAGPRGAPEVSPRDC
jgi:hypothetical protein